MKCKDCAMFGYRKDPDGNYACYLCTGTYVTPEEKELEVCKYTSKPITSDYASRRFWMLPFDWFQSKLSEIKEIIEHTKKTLKSDVNMRQKIAHVLYSQLVTALEVYLSEQFRLGLESEKAFTNFINRHPWRTRYYPNEVYGNIKELVNAEVSRINFQNFFETGRAYKNAFEVDIFGFPNKLKREVNRILRYRHSLVHQDEVWDRGRFVKIDLPKLESDIIITSDFVSWIKDKFEEKIGIPSEIWATRVNLENVTDESKIDSCKKCPLGMKFDSENIVCFEGAYDGIGFGVNISEWEDPPCGGMTFKEAMRQRTIEGIHRLFGQLSLIPERHFTPKKRSSRNKNSKS